MKQWYIWMLIVAMVGASGFLLLQFLNSPADILSGDLNIAGDKLERPVPMGMREYRDRQYEFSLLYPEDLQVSTIDEGGGASTITFQNPSAGQGFQIFVVPYFEPQITEERFKRDTPSGVHNNAENISVDGAEGVAFYSRDLVLGDTREVWFIKNNYLYEVTTLKVLEADLLKILKTWQFEED